MSGTVNSVNPVIENASSSIVLTLLGIFIFFNETQAAKVPYGIELIVFGNVTLVKFSHNINAPAPNSVTLSGIVILCNLLFPANAAASIVVTLVGIFIVCKLLLHANASAPITLTLSGIFIVLVFSKPENT